MVRDYLYIPEEFYTFKDFTIITPGNVSEWTTLMAEYLQLQDFLGQFLDLQEGMSCSGRFAAVATETDMTIASPVDYRYSWDLCTPQHQKLV